MQPAKAPVDMARSDALSIPKYKAPAQGRALGLLVTDGADAALVGPLQKAAKATAKVIAPKVGGVTQKGGKHLPADEMIAGAPLVLFDAVALVLLSDGAKALMGEKAALDFVLDAFAHCKAIGHTAEAMRSLKWSGWRPTISCGPCPPMPHP
jgi:catalase